MAIYNDECRVNQLRARMCRITRRLRWMLRRAATVDSGVAVEVGSFPEYRWRKSRAKELGSTGACGSYQPVAGLTIRTQAGGGGAHWDEALYA